jgi:very-short-patch-repair endonuclease
VTDRFDHPGHRPGAVKRARRLRREAPVSEKKLWEELRKLELRVRRQAPIGRFVVDFAHHAARLVIEVDGARHEFTDAVLADMERDAWLQSQGYLVVRVRDTEAIDYPEQVAERIALLIRSRTDRWPE